MKTLITKSYQKKNETICYLYCDPLRFFLSWIITF